MFDVCVYGMFVLLMLIEIGSIDELKCEVFGFVLYVVCYCCSQFDKLFEQICVIGYGLMFGIYMWIDEMIVYVILNVYVGNIYVNCNVIGVVVGVQLFGGEGLLGMGLKVGGVLYLQCLFVMCLLGLLCVFVQLLVVDGVIESDVCGNLVVVFMMLCDWLIEQCELVLVVCCDGYFVQVLVGVIVVLIGLMGE